MDYTNDQLAAWDQRIADEPTIPAFVKRISKNSLRAGTWLRDHLMSLGHDEDTVNETVTAWCKSHFGSRKPLTELLDLAAQHAAGSIGV